MTLKTRVSIFMSFFLSFWSVFWHYPSEAYALANADRIKCQDPVGVWTKPLAKSYAKALASYQYGWGKSEYSALNKLWTAESNWRAEAFNKQAGNEDGDHAGGIPQILGLDPKTPAPQQVERGLAYIQHRYGKPSVAWAHHRKHGWY
jgi:hypothetical protein